VYQKVKPELTAANFSNSQGLTLGWVGKAARVLLSAGKAEKNGKTKKQTGKGGI
jgi:hypothetical protein